MRPLRTQLGAPLDCTGQKDVILKETCKYDDTAVELRHKRISMRYYTLCCIASFTDSFMFELPRHHIYKELRSDIERMRLELMTHNSIKSSTLGGEASVHLLRTKINPLVRLPACSIKVPQIMVQFR